MIINKKSIAGFEVILMLLSMFAFAFMMAESLPVVIAQTSSSEPSECCEKTNTGAWCVNAPADECNEDYGSSPTSCETTSYCRTGTCYESEEGICMENTPQRVCNDNGGTWDAREIENVPQCQLGCCIIADQASFVSLVRCKRLSSLFGVENDYRTDITDEVECIATAQAQDVGACVYESDFERVCEFTTRGECGAGDDTDVINGTNVTISSQRTFYKDFLCSAEELNTACAKQSSTGCYQQKVYWLDSCGNRENIYSNDKVKSWNNGKVLEPDEVCNPNDGSNKNCGNCDYFLGSRCSEFDGLIGGPSNGDYYCQKTECVDRDGNKRINGESWCVYDGNVGSGSDAPGSRHYREICIDGGVIVEPCADFRNEVCYEDSIDTDVGSFGTAGCRVNRWQDCIMQDNEDSCVNVDKRDCIWKESVMGILLGSGEKKGTFSNPTADSQSFSNPTANEDGFNNGVTGNVVSPITGDSIFGGNKNDSEDVGETETNRPNGICVPNFPPGLEFWKESSAQQICGQASARCVIRYEKTLLGGRKITEGEECLGEEWAQNVNNVCTSLGDCGGYINYNGVYSGKGYNWVVDGNGKKFGQNTVNIISGAVIGLITGNAIIGDGGRGFITGMDTSKSNHFFGLLKLKAGGFADASIGGLEWAGIAYGAGLLIGKLFGMTNTNTKALSTALAAGFGSYKFFSTWSPITTEGSKFAFLGNPLTGVAIGAIVFILMYKTEDVEVVSFDCMPWQSPTGTDDCEVCNDDNLLCSEYRCKSLGQSCELVNKGTDQETCVSVNPKDVDPPIIKPLKSELSHGHDYTNVKNSPPGPGFNIINLNSSDGCLDAFTPLEFGIETDEPAQCKISPEHTTSFDDMVAFFGGSNLYSYNHSEKFSLPSAKTIQNSSMTIENGKDLTFFIRCADKNGNENEAEYAVRFCVDPTPDTTAPIIKATSIVNGGCVAENQDTAEVRFYTNEPAECRWSPQDQDFENMKGVMNCNNELYQSNAAQLFTCVSELTGISRDNTKFYIRCKDYAGNIENERNTMKQSYEFDLHGSTGLKMKNLQPNKTIFGAVSPSPVELRVETLFGCNDGQAICYYSETGDTNDYVEFFDTNSEDGIHTQRLDLTGGAHKYYVKCTDEGGNLVRDVAEFRLDIDTNAPVVARIYEEDELLKIVTVRNSECVYTFDNCDFTFNEGTEMPYANSTTHVTEWNEDKTYYIKCRDEFRNEGADCSVVVKPTRNLFK